MYGVWKPRLVMMVKAPKAGKAKTRLAKDIGRARAASFYRHATAALVDRLGRDSRWEMVLAVDPFRELYQDWQSVWPSHLDRVSQGQGDLGDRMRTVLGALPPGPVVIIGSDSPHIGTSLLARAFDTLRERDVVLGPAPDGGYWLIGFNRRRSATAALLNVRWSTEHTLQDTINSLPASFSVGYLSKLDDIDDAGDLAACPNVLIRSFANRNP